jgi:hypothetical protein
MELNAEIAASVEFLGQRQEVIGHEEGGCRHQVNSKKAATGDEKPGRTGSVMD